MEREQGGIARLRDTPTERDIQEHPERVDIRPAIHRVADRPPLAQGLNRPPMLGRHESERPAQPLGRRLFRIDRTAGQVEVQQHRLAIAGQEHVGRLDIHMDQVALVRVLQPVCQAAPIQQIAST